MKNILRIIIPLVVVVFIFIYYREGLLPVNTNNKASVIFVIDRGTPLQNIIKDLYKQNLIRSEISFYLLTKQKGIDSNLQAGVFRLSQSMSAQEIATALTKGSLDILVTFIEGLRKEEVAQILAEKVAIPSVEFIESAQEGYLFPDTYFISKGATTEMVLLKFKENFDRKYTEEMRQTAIKKNLTDLQVITLASLVEREAKAYPDRVQVASIMLRRLSIGMKLDIDATVQYAVGYQSNTHTWWKKNLTLFDLKINSPYNTRTHAGLPPGPIGNPGLSAIQAVLEATPNTPYLYYISNTKGTQMHYAGTLEEHNENKRKYLGK